MDGIGTSADYGTSVAVDSNENVYVAGDTNGNLFRPRIGFSDAFLVKYDSNGDQLWAHQFGTTAIDTAMSVTLGTDGNAFVTGYTQGNIADSNAGGYDAFLSKYDSNGNPLWSRQIGTTENDEALSVTVDRFGNSYIGGRTYGNLYGDNNGNADVFLTKFDKSGNQLWTRQFGTWADDVAFSVAVDSHGNLFVSGYSRSDIDGTPRLSHPANSFLSKFDSEGGMLWTTQIYSLSENIGYSVAVDGRDNVFMTGHTYGSLFGSGPGGPDAFLVKFAAQVPEPTSWLLIALGGIGVFSLIRRSTRSAAPRRLGSASRLTPHDNFFTTFNKSRANTFVLPK